MGLFNMADEKLIENFTTNIRKGAADVLVCELMKLKKNNQYSMLNVQFSIEMHSWWV